MWSKITHALKPRHAHDEEQPPSSQGDIMSKVYEQHPNLSVFHHSEEPSASPTNPSPPPSPSKHSRLGVFKRLSKAPLREDAESAHSPSPFKLPGIPIPKKVKSNLDYNNGNGSQLSLAHSAADIPRASHDTGGRPSFDALRPAQESTRTSSGTFRRPSIDMLRQDSSRPSQDSIRLRAPPLMEEESGGPTTPANDGRMNSVRSILRDPKTPGTGQNVRFFSRDAYKTMTPDQSLEADFLSLPQHPPRQELSTTFLDRLNSSNTGNSSPALFNNQGPFNSTPAAITRSMSGLKSPRTNVADVFPTLGEGANANNSAQDSTKSLVDFSIDTPIPHSDFSNIFDVSQQLDIPPFPPGLGFDINAPTLDGARLNTSSEVEHATGGNDHQAYSAQMTSTPYKPNDTKGKGKEKASDKESEKENLEVSAPTTVDEAVFHSQEKPPRLLAPLHDRSQSFSFGQTVFYSMANSTDKGSPNVSGGTYPSSDLKGDADSPSHSSMSSKGHRSRALSDTMFQKMIRASPEKSPEDDINDESSSELVVYSAKQNEPDPFRADANTYYTPQSMIPPTPPKETIKHARKTSKEDSIIFSLQTQLALQTELCGQYEADLRARDEVVEILGKRVSDLEKDESKRKNALRSWKKKVQELERACRQLEEEVDTSRQESMDRSVMDEASGEALRMLHRQIAGLERERGEATRREEMLREEVETLENLVKERSEDVMNLKEMLWNRDESERELKEGIREAKEQIEMLGNVSVPVIDTEEIRKIAMEKEQTGAEESKRHNAAEFTWQQERSEIINKLENTEVQKVSLEEQVDSLRQQLRNKEEEYAVLKNELEAQWAHTEKATDRIEELEKEKTELVEDRDAFKRELEELERRTANMEMEWNESENRKNELENDVQELWNEKEVHEKERAELEEHLRQETEHAESLTHALQEREDRIASLEHELQFATDNIARLEANIRNRDNELEQYSQLSTQRESEAEQLREEISKVKRELSRMAGEQNRVLEEAASEEGETRRHMEELIRQKASADVELKTLRDRTTLLTDDVERLRKQVHDLQQESADKEVKILQITKQRSQDKEDLQGLNIALDSKQQELELLKRKIGVRGTAGSTPAQASKSSGAHRRDSSVFNSTPLVSSRPPSVASDSGVEGIAALRKKLSSEGTTPTAKIPALGRSSRLNGSSSATSSTSKRIEGSMGPPPLKPRVSMATPTPSGRVSSLSRSSSAKPTAQVSTPAPHRRVSSATVAQPQSKAKGFKSPIHASPVTSLSEASDKENIDNTSSSVRRRSLIPTAV